MPQNSKLGYTNKKERHFSNKQKTRLQTETAMAEVLKYINENEIPLQLYNHYSVYRETPFELMKQDLRAHKLPIPEINMGYPIVRSSVDKNPIVYSSPHYFHLMTVEDESNNNDSQSTSHKSTR